MLDTLEYHSGRDFKLFLRVNGIKHVTSAPYHPASNGLAERAVQTFKAGIKKMKEGSLVDKLSRFLFTYCNSPQTTTGVYPAEMLIGRCLRSRLDLIKPDLQARVHPKQMEQKQSHDHHAKDQTFGPKDQVFAKNIRQGQPWVYTCRNSEEYWPSLLSCSHIGFRSIVETPPRPHQDSVCCGTNS